MACIKRQRRTNDDIFTVPSRDIDLLTAVAAVARATPQLLGLQHVLQRIIDLLISARLERVEAANKAGLYSLVNWILSRCNVLKLPPLCRKWRLLRGVSEAAAQGSIALIELWFYHFPDLADEAFQPIYHRAVCRGHVHLLEWLQSRGAFADDEFTSNLITGMTYSRPAVVYWLHNRFPMLCLSISIDNVAKRASGEHSMEFLKWLWRRKNNFAIEHTSCAQTSAASRGDLPMLTWLHNHKVGNSNMAALNSAAQNGHFEAVKWLYERLELKSKIALPTSSSAKLIVHNGHFEIFNWLFVKQSSFGDEPRIRIARQAMKEAAYQGRLNTLQLVYDIAKEKFRGPDVVRVAQAGHLNILKWLFERQPQTFRNYGNRMVDCAAEEGYLEVIQFLHEKGRSGSVNAMDNAAATGHFEVLKWLHRHRKLGCTTRATDGAVKANRLDIVEWLHDNRSEGCTTDAMEAAARNGWMEMVQWLHVHHHSECCSVDSLDSAAAYGHLEIVKWLHENCSEGNGVSTSAACFHLEVIQWLHENFSIQFTECDLIGVAARGHLKIMQYLHPRCFDGDLSHAKQIAIQLGRLRVVQWIHRNGCAEWNRKAFIDCVKCGLCVTTVDWLYTEFASEFQSWDSDAFVWPQNEADLSDLSDDILEWMMMVHFPKSVYVDREIRRRLDKYAQTIKYSPYLELTDTEFGP